MGEVLLAAGKLFGGAVAKSVTVKTVATLAVSHGISRALEKKARKADARAYLESRFQNIWGGDTNPRELVYGEVRKGGTVKLAHETGSNNKYLWIVVQWADHTCDSVQEHFIDGEGLARDGGDPSRPATGSVYRGADAASDWLRVWDVLGSDTQTVEPNLNAADPAVWTAAHRLRGRTYSVYRLLYDPEASPWADGIPVFTARLRGKNDIYDPVSDTTGYFDSWALCSADFLTSPWAAGMRVEYTDISEPDLIAAANVCAESVDLGVGGANGTEARYTVGGTFLSTDSPQQILQTFRDCSGNGMIEQIGDKYVIHAGAWRAPTVTLTGANLRGPLVVQPRDNAQDVANRVRGVYPSAENNYEPYDYPAVTNATYLSQDDGQELWRDMDFPLVTSAARCQRLAKIELERTRQGQTLRGIWDVEALQLKRGDVVTLDDDDFGFASKDYEVVSWTWRVRDLEPVVEMTLRETASAIYDWAGGDETDVDLAPNSTLDDPRVVPAPTGLSFDSSSAELLQMSASGTVRSHMEISWTPAATGLPPRLYEVEWATAAQYAGAGFTNKAEVPYPGTRIAPEVADGVEYYARVRAVNALGNRSDWLGPSNHTVVGKGAAPAAPTDLDASPLVNAASFTWTPSTDVDIAETLIYLTTVDSAPAKGTTTDRWEVRGNTLRVPGLTAGVTYYGFARTIDTSGNISDSVAGSVSVTPASSATAVALSASGQGYLFAADSAGVVADYSVGDGDVELFLGTTQKAYNATPTNDTWRFGTITAVGVTQNGGLTAPEVGITAMAGNDGYLAIPCIYRDTGGVDADPVNIRVSYAKAVAGADGAAGSNTAPVYIFKRAPSPPTLPSGSTTYTFATGVLTGLDNGWTQAIPAADGNPLYVAAATANATGASDSIGSGEWTTPVVQSIDGAPGAAGLNSATVYLYQRTSSASAPAKPGTTLTYTFATGVLSGTLGSWSQTLPTSGGAFRHMITAQALSASSSVGVDSSDWSDVAILSADGNDGNDGAAGLNNAAVFIFKRSASTPTLPSASTTYTFATGVLTGLNNGWTQAVPADDGNPLYVSLATASATTATDAIGSGEWATPVVHTLSPSDGDDGGDGLNSATVFLYQRTSSASAPAKPSTTLTYTFATGVLSGSLGSWSQSLPTSGGAYRHVTTAAALATGATDSILSSEWSDVAILAEDGSDGSDGSDGADSLDTLPAVFGGKIGGFGSFELNLNTNLAGGANNGEIQVASGVYRTPAGATIQIPTAELNSNYGEGGSGRFYIMYTATDATTRWSGISWLGGQPEEFVPIVYDAGAWKVMDNNSNFTTFTPVSTDVIVAAVEAVATTGGLTRMHKFYGVLQPREYLVSGGVSVGSNSTETVFSASIPAGNWSASWAIGGGGSGSSITMTLRARVGGGTEDSDADTGSSVGVAVNFADEYLISSTTTFDATVQISGTGSGSVGGTMTITEII